jgi:hypothetical protein
MRVRFFTMLTATSALLASVGGFGWVWPNLF